MAVSCKRCPNGSFVSFDKAPGTQAQDCKSCPQGKKKDAVVAVIIMLLLYHDDFNTDKVCNSANPTQVGFVHIYEPCILVTFNAFYVTSHWESQLGTYFQNRFLRSKH